MLYIESIPGLVATQGYETVAIDIYGVIHNGAVPYPHARQCLESLTKAGVRTILLSNSTRLGEPLAKDLADRFGIPRTAYNDILSSGVLTQLFLHALLAFIPSQITNNRRASFDMTHVATVISNGQEDDLSAEKFYKEHIKHGRFYLVGNEGYHGPLYEQLAPAITRTMDWHEPIDFVLLGSIISLPGQPPLDDLKNAKDIIAHYQSFMDHCLKRGIPMVCANPDVWAPGGLNPDGSTFLSACPGFLGKMYTDMGGKVLYFGKPFESIYRYLLNNKIKSRGDRENGLGSQRVLCVGDNVLTDVLGARRSKLDVAMVLGGIHSHLFGDEVDPQIQEKVQKLCEENSSETPTYIIPLLQ